MSRSCCTIWETCEVAVGARTGTGTGSVTLPSQSCPVLLSHTYHVIVFNTAQLLLNLVDLPQFSFTN